MNELGRYLGGRMDHVVGGRERLFRDCEYGSFQRRLRDETRRKSGSNLRVPGMSG